MLSWNALRLRGLASLQPYSDASFSQTRLNFFSISSTRNYPNLNSESSHSTFRTSLAPVARVFSFEPHDAVACPQYLMQASHHFCLTPCTVAWTRDHSRLSLMSVLSRLHLSFTTFLLGPVSNFPIVLWLFLCITSFSPNAHSCVFHQPPVGFILHALVLHHFFASLAS